MKLILESWRQYLKEQQAKESLGVMVDFNEGYEISLSLVDLNKIKQQLANSNSVQDFAEKIKNREMYDASKVDGANFIQQFFFITFPNLKSVLFLSLIHI